MTMFGKFGQLASLLGNLPKIKAEMENLKERLSRLSADGDAGGGMVRVKVSGHFQVLSCTIAPDLLSGGDRELLEDLIVAATNQALERVRQLAAQETSKMAQEFGLPPGMEIPGLGAT
jgi:DNA-binding YbaB/EbfC family protein